MAVALTLFSAAAMLALVADARRAAQGAPAPFDKGGVKIALVNYLSEGDFFQPYEARRAEAGQGARDRSAHLRGAAGCRRTARADSAGDQRFGVSAIIVNHGLPESLKDVRAASVG